MAQGGQQVAAQRRFLAQVQFQSRGWVEKAAASPRLIQSFLGNPDSNMPAGVAS